MSPPSRKTPLPWVVHLPGEAKASKELCSCPSNAPIPPIVAITQLPDLGLKRPLETPDLGFVRYWHSRQLVEQRPCFFQVLCVEAFGEPAVDRREKVAGFGGAALVAAELGEAHRRAQFPKPGLLLHGDAQGLAIQFLGGLGILLPQQQLAFVPVQLRCKPALPRPFDEL